MKIYDYTTWADTLGEESDLVQIIREWGRAPHSDTVTGEDIYYTKKLTKELERVIRILVRARKDLPA